MATPTVPVEGADLTIFTFGVAAPVPKTTLPIVAEMVAVRFVGDARVAVAAFDEVRLALYVWC